jgi:hypothetical protein
MTSAPVFHRPMAMTSTGRHRAHSYANSAPTMPWISYLLKKIRGLRTYPRLRASRLRYYAAREWIAMLAKAS